MFANLFANYGEANLITGLFKSLRPKQWTKNGVIFAALIFDVKLFQFEPLIKTILGFILLCAISGTVYLINDLVDIEKDRQHLRQLWRLPLLYRRYVYPSVFGLKLILGLL